MRPEKKSLSEDCEVPRLEVHKSEDPSLQLIQYPVRLSSALPNPPTFLALPGEIRNEIYSDVLRCPKERYLKFKLKANASGNLYVKTQTPPLCYAVPSLWKEVLSVYYTTNQFRILIITPAQRNAFQLWASHRKQMLKGVKSLRLIHKSSSFEAQHANGTKIMSSKDFCTTLRLTITASGQLAIRLNSRCFSGCGCWLLQTVNEELGIADADTVPAERESRAKEGEEMGDINPVLDFALKFCKVLDLCGCRNNRLVDIRWLQIDEPTPRARCGEQRPSRRRIESYIPCAHCGEGFIWGDEQAHDIANREVSRGRIANVDRIVGQAN